MAFTQQYSNELLCFNHKFNYFSSDFITPLLEFHQPYFYSPQHTFNGCNLRNALQIPAKFEVPAADGNVMEKRSRSARERRKKIAEKTQELGKLIPGGNSSYKMNTAQMLLCAFNYVKFLQAQVYLLRLMCENQFWCDELRFLLPSAKIQEKLFSVEKCLIPTEFLRNMANHNHIQIHLLLGDNC